MSIFQAASCQTILVNGQIMDFNVPKVMGILNLTPDSFYDNGRFVDLQQAKDHASNLLDEGADILDLGAYSTRPGAKEISVQEELDRIMPMVEYLHQYSPQTILSIDTFRSQVASETVHAGAHIINDVSGGLLDAKMFETVATLQVPYILMHMRGTPATMQNFTDYDDLVSDVATHLGKAISQLRKFGVKDIILDPGFGFAKTIAQNYELLLRVDELQYFGLPILGGISRKSMIYKKINKTADDVLPGTIALNTLLLQKGVQLLRVHDVKEAKQLIEIFYS
ncbi:dihydropteroate synthase [Sphingobacterium sp. HJSM2_6]|uniref:dihydropteroate synthase n=1 Tax=Sphingobacterium sp. HJSM2_6 TaxID=3366264 RepID=UPI003BCB4890